MPLVIHRPQQPYQEPEMQQEELYYPKAVEQQDSTKGNSYNNNDSKTTYSTQDMSSTMCTMSSGHTHTNNGGGSSSPPSTKMTSSDAATPDTVQSNFSSSSTSLLDDGDAEEIEERGVGNSCDYDGISSPLASASAALHTPVTNPESTNTLGVPLSPSSSSEEEENGGRGAVDKGNDDYAPTKDINTNSQKKNIATEYKKIINKHKKHKQKRPVVVKGVQFNDSVQLIIMKKKRMNLSKKDKLNLWWTPNELYDITVNCHKELEEYHYQQMMRTTSNRQLNVNDEDDENNNNNEKEVCVRGLEHINDDEQVEIRFHAINCILQGQYRMRQYSKFIQNKSLMPKVFEVSSSVSAHSGESSSAGANIANYKQIAREAYRKALTIGKLDEMMVQDYLKTTWEEIDKEKDIRQKQIEVLKLKKEKKNAKKQQRQSMKQQLSRTFSARRRFSGFGGGGGRNVDDDNNYNTNDEDMDFTISRSSSPSTGGDGGGNNSRRKSKRPSRREREFQRYRRWKFFHYFVYPITWIRNRSKNRRRDDNSRSRERSSRKSSRR